MSLTRLLTRCLTRTAILLLAATPLAVANTIHVPADQPTIQAGINAANTGDTVVVAPGTYYENINFNGKAITVTSSAGAASTILDGRTIAPVVSFISGESTSSILNGFTLRNGSVAGGGGGGVYIHNASPAVLNNIIDSNLCNGIYVSYSSAQIQGNTISNTLFYAPGGTACEYNGGAIIVFGASPTILGNTIETSSALTGWPDGILLWVASGTQVQNNIIRQNHGDGVAIVNTTGTVVIVQNLIYGNDGAGINALIPSTAGQYGSPQQLFVNNTVSQNGASGRCSSASQICLSGDLSGAVLANNVIKASSYNPALGCDNPFNFTPLVIQQNDVFNSVGAAYGTSTCPSQTGTNGNIEADPSFNNAATNDFHLLSTSPGIDKGENSVLQVIQSLTGLNLSTDLDGNPRIQNATGNGCIIDIGAYEYPGLQNSCNTTETLTSSLNPALFALPITFTAQLSSANGTPTGDVQFLDGTTILSTQTVSATGSAAFTTSALAIGTHTITASYQPSGTFRAASASLSQVITAPSITVALTTSINPSIAYQSVPLTAVLTLPPSAASMTTLSGTVTFSVPAGTLSVLLGSAQVGISGTASINTTQLPLGTDPILASFSGIVSYSGITAPVSANSALLAEVVNPAPTTLTLSASATTLAQGQPLTLTSTIADAPSALLPFGVIAFREPATGALLGTQQIPGAGTVTLTTSSLSVGTHQLLATYAGVTTPPGASLFLPSQSAPVSVTVIQQDLAVAFTPPTLTLETLHAASAPFTLTSIGSLADTLDLTCTNLPADTTCTIASSPMSLTNGQTITSSVTIDTKILPVAALTRPTSPFRRIPPAALATLLPLALLLLRKRHPRTRIHLLATLILSLAAFNTLTGCTWTGYSPAHPAPGTYTLTLTATGRTTGITHSTPLTLTVTP